MRAVLMILSLMFLLTGSVGGVGHAKDHCEKTAAATLHAGSASHEADGEGAHDCCPFQHAHSHQLVTVLGRVGTAFTPAPSSIRFPAVTPQSLSPRPSSTGLFNHPESDPVRPRGRSPAFTHTACSPPLTGGRINFVALP